MAAINDGVYARVREKVNEHNLTDQEVKAIDTARDQLQTHTYTGGLAGATAAFFLGKSKKFNPIQILALTGGGFLMGSQMGLISGALAGVKTINGLPNPQRLINVIREVQMEAARGRQQLGGTAGAAGAAGANNRGGQPSAIPNQMTPQELHEAQNPQDQFSPDVQENHQGAWNNRRQVPASFSSGNEMDITDATDPLSLQNNTAQTRTNISNKPPQSSAWDNIRAENLPNNTWSKIRMEAQQNPDDVVEIAKSKAERAKRLRENADMTAEELPRTREEAIQRGSSRKNQWGDSLE